MGNSMKDEFHFLIKRFRHKLLFQIGLTDDPWQPKNDFVFDEVYSQDPGDIMDVLRVRRSASYDKLNKGVKKSLDDHEASLVSLSFYDRPSATAAAYTGESPRKLLKA